MKIIIGLGNPGPQYRKNWHNLGFLALDTLKQDLDLNNFKDQSKLQASLTEGHWQQQKVILAKPLTYMNNSGQAVQLVTQYYHAQLTDIIIIHDDIDLNFGQIRISRNSSAGGHNGVKSIIHALGSQDFVRLRIGVKTPKLARVDTADYVLENIHLLHGIKLRAVLGKTSLAVQDLLTKSLPEAMNLHN